MSNYNIDIFAVRVKASQVSAVDAEGALPKDARGAYDPRLHKAYVPVADNAPCRAVRMHEAGHAQFGVCNGRTDLAGQILEDCFVHGNLAIDDSSARDELTLAIKCRARLDGYTAANRLMSTGVLIRSWYIGYLDARRTTGRTQRTAKHVEHRMASLLAGAVPESELNDLAALLAARKYADAYALLSRILRSTLPPAPSKSAPSSGKAGKPIKPSDKSRSESSPTKADDGDKPDLPDLDSDASGTSSGTDTSENDGASGSTVPAAADYADDAFSREALKKASEDYEAAAVKPARNADDKLVREYRARHAGEEPSKHRGSAKIFVAANLSGDVHMYVHESGHFRPYSHGIMEQGRIRWQPAYQGVRLAGASRLASAMAGNRVPVCQKRTAGGTILVDCSASMGISPDEVTRLIKARPASVVAGYGADSDIAGNGDLMVLAKEGKIRDRWTLGGCNLVDYQALLWLRKQTRPLTLVTDLGFTGPESYKAGALVADMLKRHELTLFPNVRSALRHDLTASKDVVLGRFDSGRPMRRRRRR